ncbi:hypothetical protein J7J74_02840 [bacterium]|nr:hypothetical protein [bacterium]
MKKTKNKILHFLQYHNLTLVILMFIIGFGTASLASDNVRSAIFDKEVREVGVDNTMLLTADIDNFDFQPQITDIEEDENYYYVDYQYKTLGVKDNVWQEVIQEKELKVPKKVLAQSNKDLPSYITEEIGEVIMHEYQLLKDSQKIAREQGLTKKQKVIAYRGLIGKILNLQPKVIVENQEKLAAQISETEIAQSDNTQQLAESSQQETGSVNTEENSQQPSLSRSSSLEDFVDKELIRQIVEEILAQREQENQEVLAMNNQGAGNTQSSQMTEQSADEQITTEQSSTDEQVSEQASEQMSEEQQAEKNQQEQEDQQEISEGGDEEVEATEEDINQGENLTESQQEDQQEQVQQDQEQNQTQSEEEEGQTQDQQQEETNGGDQTQQQNQGEQQTQPSSDQSQSGDQNTEDSQATPDNNQQTQGQNN